MIGTQTFRNRRKAEGLRIADRLRLRQLFANDIEEPFPTFADGTALLYGMICATSGS
jgi:hypothetical protein